MKKWKLISAVGILVIACSGCGAKEVENAQPVEEITVAEEQAENEQPVIEQTEIDRAESEAEEKNENYADLEEKGVSGEIAAFAEQIQAAAADKNMEALADLCSYPLAVNGEVVESREDFLALGADEIFTEERCAVIESVDVSTLEETMAGVIMGDGTPNIIFKSVDGKLGITGIN